MLPKTQGFGLIEVLVTLAVVSVGLVGMVVAQIVALQSVLDSGNRTQGLILALDMAERIKANNIYAQTDGSNYISSTPATLASYSPVAMPCFSNVTAVGDTPTSCTPAQMAQQDIWEFQQAISYNLLALQANGTPYGSYTSFGSGSSTFGGICSDTKTTLITFTGGLMTSPSLTSLGCGSTTPSPLSYSIKVAWSRAIGSSFGNQSFDNTTTRAVAISVTP